MSLGTSGTVYVRSDRPTADPTGTVAGFADAAGGYLPLACTLNATRVTDTVAGLLDVPPDGRPTSRSGRAHRASGLTLVPYFDGERTPDRPSATGTLAGLRTGVARADVARRAFEGVVCGLLDALDVLSALVEVGAGPLLAVGGGSRSPAYRRALADLSGRPVVVPDLDEAVATGACVQAAATLTGRSPAEVRASWALGGGDRVEPDGTVDAAAVRAGLRRSAGLSDRHRRDVAPARAVGRVGGCPESCWPRTSSGGPRTPARWPRPWPGPPRTWAGT